MSLEIISWVLVTSISPVIAALIPKFALKGSNGELNPKALQIMLGLSAGLLFAIATLDLIPEAMNIEEAAHKANERRREMGEVSFVHNSETVKEQDTFGLSRNPSMNKGTGSVHTREPHDHDTEKHHENHEHGHSVSWAMMGVAAGFFALIFIESASGHGHSHGGSKKSIQVNDIDIGVEMKNTHSALHRHNDDHSLSSEFSFAALVGLTIHCFMDGVLIASAWSASDDIGTRVSLGLLFHKFPDGFVMAAVLSTKKSLDGYFYSILGFLATMTPLGAFVWVMTMGETVNGTFLGFVLGFGAGTFIFIMATGLVPHLLKAKSREMKTLSVLSLFVGYGLFILLELFLSAH